MDKYKRQNREDFIQQTGKQIFFNIIHHKGWQNSGWIKTFYTKFEKSTNSLEKGHKIRMKSCEKSM